MHAPHPPGATTHAPPKQPHMPPPGSNHACLPPPEQPRTPPPGATMHAAPLLTESQTGVKRMHSSRMHTARSLTVSRYLIISQAHTPRATTHAPPTQNNHTHPQSNHACPLGATKHAPPKQPHMPPCSNHACHPPTEQPHMPPVNRMTNRCKNITLPQLRCGR